MRISEFSWFEPDSSVWWRDRAVVLLIASAIFLPLLGSFGLWDPWETHYGEVGRQITERNDWISTWWGSHWTRAAGGTEGSFFYSKPILLMWMMALGVELFGVNELAIRLGVALVTIVTLVLVYSFGASVFSRRSGYLMAGVLATSPFWFFLGRQAQTDMPFVAMMTAGMCFFMMGVFGRDRQLPADKFSYVLTTLWMLLVSLPQVVLLLVGLSRWRGPELEVMHSLSVPATHGIIFGGVLFGISALLLVASLWNVKYMDGMRPAWQKWCAWGALTVLWLPLLGLLIYVVSHSPQWLAGIYGWFVWGPTQGGLYLTALGLALYLTISRPIVERRRLYLLNFYVFIGLATLAKGLLGFMLPGAVIFFYILLSRDWGLLKRAELLRGILIFIAVTFPWYAAMLIRHHPGFWQRFFVHDHFHRLATGVHQLTTGSFEHFIRWLGYGLFPWAAFIPVALAKMFSGQRITLDDDKGRATFMLILWMLIAFVLFTLSSTKFHHYIFPVVPALAMLIALALDDVFEEKSSQFWPLYFIGVGVFVVVAWDIVADPQNLKNLFTYQYEREWNHDAWDAQFQSWLILCIIPGAIGVLLMLAARMRARHSGVALIFLSAACMTIFSLHVYMPGISSSWSQKELWETYYQLCGPIEPSDGMDTRKRYCKEPAFAYKLNWRGETYYTQNELIPIRSDSDFMKFLDELQGSEAYGIMEWSRYRGEFQRKLPEEFKGRSCIVHHESLRFVLAKIPCADDDPAHMNAQF